MTEITEITEITKSISKWNEIGSKEQVEFLKLGNNFNITRSQYESLLKDDGNALIHIYVGVNELNNLEFYLINSERDANKNYSSIIICDYNYGLDNNEKIPNITEVRKDNITLLQGLERMFRFQMEFPNWVNSRDDSNPSLQPMFRAFNLNFNDLNFLFSDQKSQSVMACFGMRSYENKNGFPFTNSPELIIWNKDFTSANLLADVVLPCPPFYPSKSKYTLL